MNGKLKPNFSNFSSWYIFSLVSYITILPLSNTKIFSHSINGYSDSVNTNVNIIDLGYPGVLPRVNKEVVHKALKAALALNCSINKKMHFDRNCYYYPDLPKGYQITQNDTPIGFNGRL